MMLENDLQLKTNKYSVPIRKSDSQIYLQIRRVIEILVILITIPLILPFTAILTIILYFQFNGKPFFTQVRAGYFGKPFIIYKFKTMNDEILANEDCFHHCSARETKLGTFLRTHRIDEIPQLLNVLKGEMSIVGPRPEAYYHFQYFSERIEFYQLRKCVPQGLTGLAQICHPYTDTLEGTIEKLKYDFYYISNLSFKNDLVILLKTLHHILIG